MPSVACSAPSRNGTPPRTPSDLLDAARAYGRRLYVATTGDFEPLIRYALHEALRSVRALGQLPMMPAASCLEDTAAAVLDHASRAGVDPVQLVENGIYKYRTHIPLIQVDALTRNLTASDVPTDALLVLFRLAGHVSNENGRAWEMKTDTGAGECGMSAPTWRKVTDDLAKHGFITKVERFTCPGIGLTRVFRCPVPPGSKAKVAYVLPNGEPLPMGSHAAPTLFALHPERGTWWGATQRRKPGRSVHGGEAGEKSRFPGVSNPVSHPSETPLTTGGKRRFPEASGENQPNEYQVHDQDRTPYTPRVVDQEQIPEDPPNPPQEGGAFSQGDEGQEHNHPGDDSADPPPDSHARPVQRPDDGPVPWTPPAHHLPIIEREGLDVDKLVAWFIPDGPPLVTPGTRAKAIVDASWNLAIAQQWEDPEMLADAVPMAAE
jgi:hypothetical protein